MVLSSSSSIKEAESSLQLIILGLDESKQVWFKVYSCSRDTGQKSDMELGILIIEDFQTEVDLQVDCKGDK